GPRRRRMALKIPICFVDGLPNPVQIGFAIRCPWRPVSPPGLTSGRHRGPREDGDHDDCHNHRATEPISHRIHLRSLSSEEPHESGILNAHSRLVKTIARFRFSTGLLDQKMVRIRTATDQNEVHFDKVAVAMQGRMKRWPMLVERSRRRSPWTQPSRAFWRSV